VGLVLAVARHHPRPGVFGLDAEPQPVCARRGAGQPADFFGQAVDVGDPGRRGVGVVVGGGDVFGEVLAPVADRAVSPRGPGQQALQVVLAAEPHDVGRFGVVVGVKGVEGLVPGRQHRPRCRVDVAADVV
jgi:hypothetical protein